MAVLFRIDNDFSTNKAPRMPICICIENSKYISSEKADDLPSFLKMVTEYIAENSELKAKVQLAVICYGAKPTVVTDFAPVSNTSFTLPERAENEEPDLFLALQKFKDLLNARIKLYRSESISHYLPQLLIMGSGHSSSDITGIASKLITNKLSVLPIQTTKNPDSVFKHLTVDGFVDTDETNFVEVFNCLKSGLELLSTSSASAGKSLKDGAVGLNSIKKG